MSFEPHLSVYPYLLAEAPYEQRSGDRRLGLHRGLLNDGGIDGDAVHEGSSDGCLTSDLEKALRLFRRERFGEREASIDVSLLIVLRRRVAKSDRNFAEFPVLAAGVHPQRDRRTSAQAREQQFMGRGARIAPAARDRLVGRQSMMAGRDQLGKLMFTGDRNMSH